VGVQGKLWNPLRTRAIPERFCGGDSLRRGAISSVCTFTFTGHESTQKKNISLSSSSSTSIVHPLMGRLSRTKMRPWDWSRHEGSNLSSYYTTDSFASNYTPEAVLFVKFFNKFIIIWRLTMFIFTDSDSDRVRVKSFVFKYVNCYLRLIIISRCSRSLSYSRIAVDMHCLFHPRRSTCICVLRSIGLHCFYYLHSNCTKFYFVEVGRLSFGSC